MLSINTYYLCFVCSLQTTLINGANKMIENRNDHDDTTILTKSILKRCFENNNVFLTHGKHDNTDVIKEASSKSLKLFDIKNEIFSNYTRFRKIYILEEKHVRKKNFAPLGVIIDISPDINFTQTLEKMRNSIWWNGQAVFLLINRSPQENSCEALNYLMILWDFKILSAVFICRVARNAVVLYTFNPFTNSAPKNWSEVHVVNEHWTLFKLRFQQHLLDSEMCSILYFDKAKRLNGYRLKAHLVEGKTFNYDKKTNIYDRCDSNDPTVETICNVLAQMNATIDVNKSPVMGNLDKNGKPIGALNDIYNDKIDIILDSYSFHFFWKQQMAYPVYFHANTAVCLATPINLETKLSFFFKWNFWLAFILVCSACIFILKYVLRETISLAIFQFVQIALNSSCIKEPVRFYPRVLLCIVIIATSALNSFMQVHLNWFSALPKYESNLKTVIDLAKSNVTVFGPFVFKESILKYTLIKNFKGIDNFSACLDLLNNGEQAACIVNQVVLDLILWRNNSLIYRLNDPLFNLDGGSHIYVEDFPLSSKLNVVLQQMREGGLTDFLYNKYIYVYSLNRNQNYVDKQMLEFEIIDLKQFISCVFILVGGLSSAAVAFVTELLIGKIKFKKIDLYFRKKK